MTGTRCTALAGLAAALVLTGCGDDPSSDADAGQATAAEASAAQAGGDPDEYAEQVIDAFRSTYPPAGLPADVPPADWDAFARVIEDLTPPEGEELDHQRMVAGFNAYVDAREEADDVCEESRGPGGPCFTAVSTASDQWRAALDRAYQLPGLSWDALLG